MEFGYFEQYSDWVWKVKQKMFKCIGAVYHTSFFNNFNGEKEKRYDIKINGAQPFEKNLWVEPMSVVTLTERGGYVGCCFADLCVGELFDFGIGTYISSKENIIYNSKKLEKSFREKIKDNSGVVIRTEELSACFYPIFKDGFDTYIDYNARDNSVGFVSVKNGICRPQMRNISKFGVSFSRYGEFEREDSELNLFNECSFLTLCTLEEEDIWKPLKK